MPTKPPSPSSSPSASPSRERRSTRFSQKLRSLRHLRLGTSDQEEPKSAEGEFQIIHTPDRPARLVSALEAPTEEECLDEIQGWHSAAESTHIGETQELQLQPQPLPLPQLHLAVDTDFEAHGDDGEILFPLTYISPTHRSSFITDDGDDVGGIEDLSDWDRSSPTQPSIRKFSRRLRDNLYSASREQLYKPLTRSPDTPEEQFKLELESPPKEEEGLSEEQMTRLWSQLRKNKDSGRRSEPRSTATFSCFSGSDDGFSHYGEVHEAQVVDLEQLKRVEQFRSGTCPYCHKAIIDFTAAFCTFCRADLRSCKGQKPPQTISTSATAHPRPERRYDSRRPYTTELEGNPTNPSASSPPKPLKERPILDQSLRGGIELSPSHSPSPQLTQGGTAKGTPERTRNPTEARYEAPWIPDPRYDERGLSGGQPGRQTPASYHSQGDTRGDKAGHSWQSLVPTHVVEGAYAIEAKRLDDTKRNPPSSNPVYSSSYASSSSSTSSTDSRHLPSRLRPPPRLAHRAVLADLKLASSSSTPQLRTRPPPPPPERVFYADGSKSTTTRQPRLKLPQPKPPHTRDTSESGNTHTPPSPSPLRHEITSKEESSPYKQSTHPPRPRPPATQYRSPPPPPPPPPPPSSTTSPPPFRPPNRPLIIPSSPPQRPNHPYGYAIPASSGVSSTSRPNQSRPLGPDQLRPVPHQPNHPSPLLSDSLRPTRASPPTPTQPMLPSSLMAAISGPQQRPPPLPPTNLVAEQARNAKTLPPVPQDPPRTTQKDYPASVKSLATSESSAQVPVFRYDSWMTPAQRAEYERQISQHGDNADLYMDIFDDYATDGERERETETAMRHNRRRTGYREGEGGHM